jgi:hypothetical protein
MAKTMAIIKDGIVINLVWVDDNTAETDELKNVHNLNVLVGDTYSYNSYYRDGMKLITHREQLTKNIKDYDSALTDIAILVNAPMTITEDNMPSIEDRKQAILISIAGMNQALDMLNGEGSL